MRNLKGWVALGLALLGGWTAGVDEAEAQYYGQNKVQYRRYDWKSISSDHFEVYTYSGLDSLAMRVLDLAEKTHDVLSVRMGHTLTRRVPIILYGSHNDFAQTNVTPELIDAGTGGFTEALRNRVVLPFTGSYEDLRHVVVHELTHAIMFDMLYGGSAAALLARQSFFSVPLWFAEGMAEYFSLGMEPNAEMFLRDGIIEGYLAAAPVLGWLPGLQAGSVRDQLPGRSLRRGPPARRTAAHPPVAQLRARVPAQRRHHRAQVRRAVAHLGAQAVLARGRRQGRSRSCSRGVSPTIATTRATSTPRPPCRRKATGSRTSPTAGSTPTST